MGSGILRRIRRSRSLAISDSEIGGTAAESAGRTSQSVHKAGGESHPPVKMASYVTRPATAHYPKLHAMLTDHSPMHVSLFTERAAAAKWLE